MNIDQYTKAYLDQYRENGPGWFEQVLVAARRRAVLSSLSRYQPRRVLEVGCGLEPLFRHWTSFDAFTIVEPSGEFVRRAREQVPADHDVHVVEGFLEAKAEQVRARSPFDFVVVSSLLHEVSSPTEFLAAIRSLCGPDTVVHFNVPNVRSLHRLLALEMALIADLFEPSETEKKFQRTTRFDRATFHAMLEQNGFAVVDFGSYFLKPFTHGQMEKIIDSKIIPAEILPALDAISTYFPDHGAEIFANVRVRA